MRICISHLTSYRYETPASSVIQMLRLTPRNHDGQYVANWRIDVSTDCKLDQHEDAFGNITHAFTADGPFSELNVVVEGEVETRDTQGIVRGAVERFPPSLYLRETAFTRADPQIKSFAVENHRAAGGDVLRLLHRMLAQLTVDMAPCLPFPASGRRSGSAQAEPAGAAEAFALKCGAPADLAHVFIAAARSLGIPARFISGYFHCDDEQGAGHAWAEAYVPALGWVAFDATNGLCATDAHVRVAIGLDHLGAAPLRGTRYGGSGEILAVKVRVDQAGRQVQN